MVHLWLNHQYPLLEFFYLSHKHTHTHTHTRLALSNRRQDQLRLHRSITTLPLSPATQSVVIPIVLILTQ
jgi:hypothetical protein